MVWLQGMRSEEHLTAQWLLPVWAPLPRYHFPTHTYAWRNMLKPDMLKLDTKQDLETLCATRMHESLTLEYKRSDAVANVDKTKKEIGKDVSAFANAAGGQIIYGIAESGHVPTNLDDGIDQSQFPVIWFEQVIQQNISPRIEGLLIKPIEVAPGRIAVVITVPQAQSRAPHQAKDGRYYRRYNFSNQIMEDYEVRDMMRRSSQPEPFIEMLFPESPKDKQVYTLKIDPLSGDSVSVALGGSISNKSREPALYTRLVIYIDKRLRLSPETSRELIRDGIPMTWTIRSFMIPHHMPIFQEVQFSFESVIFVVPQPFVSQDTRFFIGYDISTPGYHVSENGWIDLTKGKLYLTIGKPDAGASPAPL